MGKYFFQHVKVINVHNTSYIYDANINKVCKLPERLDDDFEFSAHYIHSKQFLYKPLIDQGFFHASNLQTILHPYTHLTPELLDICQNHLILQVTHDCNLRCKYCCYSEIYDNRVRNDTSMNFSTARQSIDKFIKNSRNAKTLTISFYGGEPLLCFDLVKECVSYIEEKVRHKQVVFRMTTNATLLDQEKIEYLIEKNFLLLISLDGPEKIHDKHRVFPNNKGSYSVVMENLRRIFEDNEKFFSTINFNSVICDKADYYEIIEFYKNCDLFSRQGYDINAHLSVSSLSAGIDYPEFQKLLNNDHSTVTLRHKMNLYKSDKERTIQKIIGCVSTDSYLDVRIPRLYQRGIVKNLSVLEVAQRNKTPFLQKCEHPSGPCIPGCNKLMVDPNGVYWPCEKVNESEYKNSLGSLNAGIEIKKVNEVMNIAKRKEKSCINCWAIRYCGQCVANCSDNCGACETSKNSFLNILRTFIFTQTTRRMIMNDKYHHALEKFN